MLEESLRVEDLLRHLLEIEYAKSQEKCTNDFVYTFLLGSRLFLSPHQLITEMHRMVNDCSPLATGGVCTKCRLVHQPSSPSQPKDAPRDVENVRSIGEGEDTIRRRRRGRKRDTDAASSLPTAPSPIDGCASFVSRDSGILSAVFSDEVMCNQGKSKRSRDAPPAAAADSISEPPSTCDASPIPDRSAGDRRSAAVAKCACRKRRLLHVLHHWVRHFPADFRNKKIMWALNDVIKSVNGENEELTTECTKVVDCISRLTAAQEHYEQRLCDDDASHLESHKSLQDRKNRDEVVTFMMSQRNATHVNEFARQLYLIEMDFLKHIGAEEFLQMFTAEGDADARTNLGASVRWFNRLSHLVATVICMCCKRKRARHMITFFARVADRCYELSNFNSAMSILTGLSLGSVTRLKRTWNKLQVTELHKLQNIFDPSNNFMTYRKILASRFKAFATPPIAVSIDCTNRLSLISQRSSASRTSTCSQPGDSGIECDHDQLSPVPAVSPCAKSHFPFPLSSAKHQHQQQQRSSSNTMIPFLVLMVKDVYFLNHAIATTQSDGRINWEKLKRLSRLLHPIEEWKQCNLSYQRNEVVCDFLLDTTALQDEDLYLMSYKREAPSNRFEKQQLKVLKAARDAKKRCELSLLSARKSKTL